MTVELAMIINLHNVAIHHKINCQDAHCKVSLYELKQTAKYIAHQNRFRTTEESIEAARLIEEMPMV